MCSFEFLQKGFTRIIWNQNWLWVIDSDMKRFFTYNKRRISLNSMNFIIFAIWVGVKDLLPILQWFHLSTILLCVSYTHLFFSRSFILQTCYSLLFGCSYFTTLSVYAYVITCYIMRIGISLRVHLLVVSSGFFC